MKMPPISEQIEDLGFALVPRACSESLLGRLEATLGAVTDCSGVRERKGRVFAIRNLLVIAPELQELLMDSSLLQLARDALQVDVAPLGAILFDKIPEANWKVPAHQDVSIPVLARIDVPELEAWSRKQGVWYVEPPFEVLDRIVALRIHLNDCPADNGALEVVPGTHTARLPDACMADFSADDFRTCVAKRGDILLLKPLLVHRSKSSTVAAHRSILHVLYGGELPYGLQPAHIDQ